MICTKIDPFSASVSGILFIQSQAIPDSLAMSIALLNVVDITTRLQLTVGCFPANNSSRFILYEVGNSDPIVIYYSKVVTLNNALN